MIKRINRLNEVKRITKIQLLNELVEIEMKIIRLHKELNCLRVENRFKTNKIKELERQLKLPF